MRKNFAMISYSYQARYLVIAFFVSQCPIDDEICFIFFSGRFVSNCLSYCHFCHIFSFVCWFEPPREYKFLWMVIVIRVILALCDFRCYMMVVVFGQIEGDFIIMLFMNLSQLKLVTDWNELCADFYAAHCLHTIKTKWSYAVSGS